jgi:hypothetical protein
MPRDTVVEMVQRRLNSGNTFDPEKNNKLGIKLKKYIDDYESRPNKPRGNATKRYERAKGLYERMKDLGFNAVAASRRATRRAAKGLSIASQVSAIYGNNSLAHKPSKSRKLPKNGLKSRLKPGKPLSPILELLNENVESVSPLPKSRGPMSPEAKAVASAKRAATLASKRAASASLNLSVPFTKPPTPRGSRKMSLSDAAAAAAAENNSLGLLARSLNGPPTKKRRGKKMPSASMPVSGEEYNGSPLFNPHTMPSASMPVSRGHYNKSGNWVNNGPISPPEEGNNQRIISPENLGYKFKSKRKPSLRSTGLLTEMEGEHLNQREFLDLPLFYNPYTGVQYASENDPMPNIERAYTTLHGVLERAKGKARRKARAATRRAAKNSAKKSEVDTYEEAAQYLGGGH